MSPRSRYPQKTSSLETSNEVSIVAGKRVVKFVDIHSAIPEAERTRFVELMAKALVAANARCQD
jgi:hypothetical protein